MVLCTAMTHRERASEVIKRSVLGIMLFLFAVGTVKCGVGCLPVQSPTQLEANYTADLIACSSSAKTKAEAKTCRQDVNRRYGLCEAPWPQITPCDE